MQLSERIELAIRRSLDVTRSGSAPPKLADALRYAVLPGGARIRPTILVSVAKACGDDRPQVTDAAAAALEIIHCASLVHDDLPCFDDAGLRRGKPTVHRAHGEPLAVLTGDSLIILAFQILAQAGGSSRAIDLIQALACRTGMPGGICAGQGWESEPEVDLRAYHRSKTASLFIAATEMGAISAGHEAAPWRDLGALIGEAFQVADDLRDALLDQEALGKPVHQDELHDRPSAVASLGVEGAYACLKDILAGAIASIPSCPGEAQLAEMVRIQSEKIVPRTSAYSPV